MKVVVVQVETRCPHSDCSWTYVGSQPLGVAAVPAHVDLMHGGRYSGGDERVTDRGEPVFAAPKGAAEIEQMRLLPPVDPDELVARLKREHEPVATVCLFSGGHDSTVLAHRCRDDYDALAFIDTGTAIPGVRAFVESFAEWIQKPLRVLESGDAYRRLVLGLHKENPPPGWRPYGFPGPAGHNRAYNQIKERQLRALRAELQEGHPRGARVLMLSGIRRSESQRRRGRPEFSFQGSIVFGNPLIDWSARQMLVYRTEHRLPESEVAALLHRSGECNCGSFAAPGEREQLQALWPDWFEATIASLEREAVAAGIRSCVWGERTEGAPVEYDAPQLCGDCGVLIGAEPHTLSGAANSHAQPGDAE